MTKPSAIITPWHTTLEAGSVSIFPDGCRDLILSISDHAPATLLLTGLDDSSRLVENSTTTHYVGLRLHPAANFALQIEGNGCGDTTLTSGHELLGPWVDTLLHQPHRAEELLLEGVERWFSTNDSLCREFILALNQPDSHFGIGERQLRRSITQQTGRPPAFWRRLQRARGAAKTILDTTRPLSDIAAEHGFSDQAHLSREMRRWFDLTPGRLRSYPERYRHQFHSPDAFTP
ncbi:MAG: helix-turn-helix domain-containing protein [Chromatiales bacterium]|nr:helix-turn-helix domain-containing protein [Chromatiales bacterium]